MHVEKSGIGITPVPPRPYPLETLSLKFKATARSLARGPSSLDSLYEAIHVWPESFKMEASFAGRAVL